MANALAPAPQSPAQEIMPPFDFQLRTRVVFGDGAFARLGELAGELSFSRTISDAGRERVFLEPASRVAGERMLHTELVQHAYDHSAELIARAVGARQRAQ